MYWEHMNDMDWTWWGTGFVMIFWLILIGLGVWLVVRLTGNQTRQDPGNYHEDPATVLNRRLAVGEITIEEYRELHREIDSHAHS